MRLSRLSSRPAQPTPIPKHRRPAGLQGENHAFRTVGLEPQPRRQECGCDWKRQVTKPNPIFHDPILTSWKKNRRNSRPNHPRDPASNLVFDSLPTVSKLGNPASRRPRQHAQTRPPTLHPAAPLAHPQRNDGLPGVFPLRGNRRRKRLCDANPHKLHLNDDHPTPLAPRSVGETNTRLQPRLQTRHHIRRLLPSPRVPKDVPRNTGYKTHHRVRHRVARRHAPRSRHNRARDRVPHRRIPAPNPHHRHTRALFILYLGRQWRRNSLVRHRRAVPA